MAITGTSGPDSLTGTSFDDEILGFEGDDALFGLQGNDILRGGDGANDRLYGGAGDDLLDGGAGEFDWAFYEPGQGSIFVDLAAGIVWGGGGTDTLIGIEGVAGTDAGDVFFGDSGNNMFEGRGGDDTIDGRDGYDGIDYLSAMGSVTVDLSLGRAWGADGFDVLFNIEGAAGSHFDDVLIGDGGDNNLNGERGDDFIDGGAGNDLLGYWDATGGVTVNLATGQASGADGNDRFVHMEGVIGSHHADLLLGTDTRDTFIGNGGDDTILAGGGEDVIMGGTGNDFIDGGAGNLDWLSHDDIDGPVQVNLQAGTVTGAAGNDTIAGIEHASGTAHDDVLVGDGFDNVLQGRGGDDIVDGGAGSFDIADYLRASGGVTVDLQAGTATGADGNDTLFHIEGAHGGAYDDVLLGDGGDNMLLGHEGDDVIDGRGGRDFTSYWSATTGVTVNLAAGTATGAGNDRLSNIEGVNGSQHDDLLIGDDGDNNLHGAEGNDTLQGAGGDDFLTGDQGNDHIDGGANGPFGDTVSYFMSTGGVNVDLVAGIAHDGMGGIDTIVNIEHVEGSNFADVLSGDAVTNWFRPFAGDDQVDGRGGLDVVMYEGSASAVTIDLNAGTAFGAGIGTDRLVSIEAAHGSNFDDTITLSNALTANGGGYVFGRAGNDLLVGGTQNDNFIGGSGNDTIHGGAGRDNLSYFEDGFDGLPSLGRGVVVNLATRTATDNWGHTDTFTSIESVSGSEYADHITGSDAFNVQEFYNGNGGDDTILGGGGNDAFRGGAGNDAMDGGVITDLIGYLDLNSVEYSTSTSGIVVDLDTGRVEDGLGGVDTLANINFVTGSSHADRITGSSGLYFEQFDGGLGDDFIDGGAIDNFLGNANRVTFFNSSSAATVDLAAGTATSGLGNDTLVNINHVFGTRFVDTLRGSDSAFTESFNGRGGNDLIDGRGGLDEVRYSNAGSAVNVNLATGVATDGEGGQDTLISIEGVRGSNFHDRLTGGNAASDDLEFFMGMAGNDLIDGGSGYDRADYQSSSAGVTVTLGGIGLGSAQDGFGTIDTLVHIEGVRGSSFADTLTGSDTGAFESFEGREGDDVIDGLGGIDRADYASSIGGVNVDLAAGTAADGWGGHDTLAGIENVRGSTFDDVIGGNALANLLQGNAGNDAISAGDGDDSLTGGAGNDRLSGGAGNDQFNYAASGNGFDTITDFLQGDTLLIGANLTGPATAGDGSGLLAGAMQATKGNGFTTLYIGTDGNAGADIAIRFESAIDPGRFIVLESGDGSSLVGLAEPGAAARVAELAVQIKATSRANADVAGNVAGHSTTNEVAVGRLLEALARAGAGQDDAGGVAVAGGFDAAGPEIGLVGVAAAGMPALHDLGLA